MFWLAARSRDTQPACSCVSWAALFCVLRQEHELSWPHQFTYCLKLSLGKLSVFPHLSSLMQMWEFTERDRLCDKRFLLKVFFNFRVKTHRPTENRNLVDFCRKTSGAVITLAALWLWPTWSYSGPKQHSSDLWQHFEKIFLKIS